MACTRPTSSKPFPFFDLPAEIRNQIYAYLLHWSHVSERDHIRLKPYDSDPIILLHAEKPRQKYQTSLFYVSRRMHQEATDFFYSRNLFVRLAVNFDPILIPDPVDEEMFESDPVNVTRHAMDVTIGTLDGWAGYHTILPLGLVDKFFLYHCFHSSHVISVRAGNTEFIIRNHYQYTPEDATRIYLEPFLPVSSVYCGYRIRQPDGLTQSLKRTDWSQHGASWIAELESSIPSEPAETLIVGSFLNGSDLVPECESVIARAMGLIGDMELAITCINAVQEQSRSLSKAMTVARFKCEVAIVGAGAKLAEAKHPLGYHDDIEKLCENSIDTVESSEGYNPWNRNVICDVDDLRLPTDSVPDWFTDKDRARALYAKAKLKASERDFGAAFYYVTSAKELDPYNFDIQFYFEKIRNGFKPIIY